MRMGAALVAKVRPKPAGSKRRQRCSVTLLHPGCRLTDQAARGDEDADRVARRLHSDAGEHDDRADEDAGSASEAVGNVGSERKTGDGTNVLHRIQKSLCPARRVVELRGRGWLGEQDGWSDRGWYKTSKATRTLFFQFVKA
jgi:hypothetical protein